MRLLTLALSLAAMGALAAPAAAQFMGINAPTLAREDLDALGAASAKLYKDPDREIGSKEDWESTTGSNGVVAIAERFEHEGMPCVKLAHRIKRQKYADILKLETQQCQTPEGEWKNLF